MMGDDTSAVTPEAHAAMAAHAEKMRERFRKWGQPTTASDAPHDGAIGPEPWPHGRYRPGDPVVVCEDIDADALLSIPAGSTATYRAQAARAGCVVVSVMRSALVTVPLSAIKPYETESGDSE